MLMKETRSYQLMIRITPRDLKNLKAACKPLGMTYTTYARTVLLRDLATAFPDDEGQKNRLMEQIAEMAGEVVRALSK